MLFRFLFFFELAEMRALIKCLVHLTQWPSVPHYTFIQMMVVESWKLG